MKKNNSGSSLVAVMITVAVVGTLLGVVTSVTQYESRNVNRTILRNQAIAYGDGIMESLYDQWRNAMASTTNFDDRMGGLGNSTLAGLLTAPTTATLTPPTNVTLASWSVKSATPMLALSTQPDGRPVAEQGSPSRLRVRLYYLATITLTVKGAGLKGSSETITLERPFVRAGRNVFDYFFFGTQQETEFHPGPDMYVDGKVYIGGNLYTAHDSLHFMSEVSFQGTHTTNYRTIEPRWGDTPSINSGGFGNNWSLSNPPAKGQEQKLFDTRIDLLESRFIDDPIANDTSLDGKANNDGYHELLDEKVTGQEDPLQLDAKTSERLAENADYRIFIDLNNNLTIATWDLALGAYRNMAATEDAYKAINDALTTNTALKDAREADNVRVVTMDISKIKIGKDANKIKDNKGELDGLTFYFKDTSAGSSVATKVKNSSTGVTTNVTSSSKRGMKLVNGSILPTGGLTVASANLMYIQGDYNSGKTGTTQPASNTTSSYTPPNDKPSPVVPGYQRVPSAVAGDAVNILSNAWNDSNSLLAQTSRVASNTTINTAIIAGNVPSTGSSYSGGIENFARFHENWTNKYYTIYGALALLYNSQQAKGAWASADYAAPNRRWYYDTLFQDTNPPGFRTARSYQRGHWTAR